MCSFHLDVHVNAHVTQFVTQPAHTDPQQPTHQASLLEDEEGEGEERRDEMSRVYTLVLDYMQQHRLTRSVPCLVHDRIDRLLSVASYSSLAPRNPTYPV